MTRHVALALVVLGLGCGKGKGLQGELTAFKEAGRAVDSFVETDPKPYGAKACQSGTLDKVPALVCEYGDGQVDATRAQGQSAAETWIGKSHTGIVLRRDGFLLALSDRQRVDPSGKAIAELSRTFRKKPAK